MSDPAGGVPPGRGGMASTCRSSEDDPMGGEDDEIPPGWEMKDGNSDHAPPGGDCASTRSGGDEDALPVWKARGRRSMVDPDGDDPPPGWEAVARASGPDEDSAPGWNPLGRCSKIGQVQDAAPHLKPMPKHPGSCSEDDVRPGRRETKEMNDEDEDVPPGWEPKERDSMSGEDEDVPPGWEPKERDLMSDADEDVPPGWAPKARDSMDVTDEDVPPGWAPKERDTVNGAAVAEAPHHPVCYPDDDIPLGWGPKERDPVTGPDEDPPGWESVERNPVNGRDGDAPLGWKPKEMDSVRISSEEAPSSFEVAAEPPPPPVQSPEMGQMVCGNCRQLLSYARGAIYVQCACCQTINLVLEAHQVGNVKCGKCSVLLMYPYGAPSVRCSCCCCVTKIGEDNIRPPVSVQQGRLRHEGIWRRHGCFDGDHRRSLLLHRLPLRRQAPRSKLPGAGVVATTAATAAVGDYRRKIRSKV